MIRRAFTTVELLIVVSIIVLLAGLALPGLTMLRNQQRKAETLRLLEQLEDALAAYLDRYGRFGDQAYDDFTREPWRYLHHRPAAAGEAPYLELPAKLLLGTGDQPTASHDATRIADAWGQPLRWNASTNDPYGPDAEGSFPRRHARYVRVSSDAGSDRTGDDLVTELDLVDAAGKGWQRRRGL